MMKPSPNMSDRALPLRATAPTRAIATDSPVQHDAVFLIEPSQGIIVGVTNGIKHLTGFDPVDLVGKPFNRLYTPPGIGQPASHAEPIPERTPGKTMPLSFHCVDGTSKTFSVTFSAVQGEQKHTYMAILREMVPTAPTVTALAQEKIENEALKSLIHELKREPINGQFLSHLSHQLRTPLGIILSSTGILGRYENVINDPDQRNEYLNSISSSVHRITALLEDTVQLAKLQSGEKSFQSEPLNLPGFFHSLIEDARSAAEKKIPITFTHHDIPPLAHGDESLLRLIFLHLLANALKFSTGVQPVQLKLHRQEELCLISVQNHGIGIHPADKELLFQPFKRGQNVGDISGNGLGLAIVRHSVALHRGSITCESTPRSGTVFLVSLPLLGAT